MRHNGGRLTLVVGGMRSGKSAFAERLAAASGDQVVYLATAVAVDAEMQARVAAHQARRPSSWLTVEQPSRVGEAVQAIGETASCVLVDSITLLVSNLLVANVPDHGDIDAESSMAAVDAEITSLIAAASASAAAVIVVSDEVGQGVVPNNPLGRQFCDALGLANQRLAAAADRVYWMVAGIPVDVRAVQAAL
jgi:adenosylcobinamide kinase / adenosylcobinamide-phosphate guanylyltransferase